MSRLKFINIGTLFIDFNYHSKHRFLEIQLWLPYEIVSSPNSQESTDKAS